MASSLCSYKRRKNVCSESFVISCVPRSLNDLPDEIILNILSHLGPEELCFIISKVCKRWNVLAKDLVLWKTLCYTCGRTCDISRVAQVRCTALFRFSTNYLTNFAPSNVSNVQNPEEHFRNWTSFLPE